MRPTERWLLWRLRGGNPDACGELIARHHAEVFRYLRHLGADRHQAEDLTQETYAKAWRGLAGLRSATSLRAWLLTIARNEFLQLKRRGAERSVPLEEAPESPDPNPGALTHLIREEGDRALQSAVWRLDPSLSEVVSLHYFQELSIREIGSVLGIPLGTVKSRLNRAIRDLRSRLDEAEGSDAG